MNRFAIVGCEASGKTVLTASLADFFQPGGNSRLSCSMVPENVAAHKFLEYTNYQMRVRHAWPQATNPDKTTVMQWSMRIDGTVAVYLETLEFGGEVFRAAFREDEPTESGVAAQKELLEYLSTSGFIVVTVSIGALLRDYKRSGEASTTDVERDSEAKWVTRGLLEFVSKKMPPDTGLVIALTQADLYARELEDFRGPSRLFRKCWPTVAVLCPEVPVIAVSAVSGVSEDGNPADGYSSAGVLPLMNVFADYCVGGIDALRSSIDETIKALMDSPEDTDPEVYRQYIRDYSDKVKLFGIASGLSGDCYVGELQKYGDVLTNIQDAVTAKLHRLEDADLARKKAEEEERRKEDEIERAAREEQRKAEEAIKERQRAELAKQIENERISAEMALEKTKLEAEVELAKSRAMAKRNIAYVTIAAASLLAVACICGVYFLIDSSKRKAAVESMKVQEMQKAAFGEHLQRMVETALAGDVSAAQQILDMLERNEIAESDVNGLYKIYMLLVNEGNPTAMFRLGKACHNGTCGVKSSDFNAHWFLSMAKNSGYESAELDELMARTASAKNEGESPSQSIDMLFRGDDATKILDSAPNGAAKGKGEGDGR